jgi:RHS repeat-associated protein
VCSRKVPFVGQSDIRYLASDLPGACDGLLLVQERDGSNTPTVTYTRGRDLSGSLAGAGGIGGLLARSHGYSGGNWSSHNFYHADGNGNVTALVNSSGALQASYKYDPFGRWLSGGGSLASANGLRFSSKPWVGFAGSTTSGLYYYGYRFYDPYLQRWPNRDPIGELGGLNLYGFVGNNSISRVDTDGEKWWEWIPLVSTGVHAYQRLFGHVPGLSPLDYADCKEGTPEECQRCITAKLAQYLSNYTGVTTGADATKALIGGTVGAVGVSLGKAGLRGGAGGIATGGVLLVDAAVDAGIVFNTIFDMKDAAKNAAKNLCGCRQ